MTGTTAKLDSKTEKLVEIATETATETPALATEPTSEAKDWEAEAKKWKELSRHNEARARENAEKAKAFDELEEANKTELQKAMERAEAAEKELGQLRVQTKRAGIAAEYGVPVSLVSGSTAEEMTENAKALKEWCGEPTPQNPGDSPAVDFFGFSRCYWPARWYNQAVYARRSSMYAH